jgi:transposase
MKYSIGFRNSVLKQVLPPHNRSVASVARERGISPITIQNWMHKLKDGKMVLSDTETDVSPSQRDMNEKYRLVMESKTVSEEQLGEWLRTHGLHSEHLPLWEKELDNFVKDKDQSLKEEVVKLKKENRRLQKEAERNKAAMAEALALLTLKKKADKLFEQEEEA